jgi:hypothetical protein
MPGRHPAFLFYRRWLMLCVKSTGSQNKILAVSKKSPFLSVEQKNFSES